MEKQIYLLRYSCSCGESFKIENEDRDSGISFCPYCGIRRDDIGEDAYDGEFIYSAKEINN